MDVSSQDDQLCHLNVPGHAAFDKSTGTLRRRRVHQYFCTLALFDRAHLFALNTPPSRPKAAIRTARYTGVSLNNMLKYCGGLKEGAHDVEFMGFDTYSWRFCANCHRLYPVPGSSPLSSAQASYPPVYFPTRYRIVSMQLTMISVLLKLGAVLRNMLTSSSTVDYQGISRKNSCRSA